jgi:hypothetical protein
VIVISTQADHDREGKISEMHDSDAHPFMDAISIDLLLHPILLLEQISRPG